MKNDQAHRCSSLSILNIVGRISLILLPIIVLPSGQHRGCLAFQITESASSSQTRSLNHENNRLLPPLTVNGRVITTPQFPLTHNNLRLQLSPSSIASASSPLPAIFQSAIFQRFSWTRGPPPVAYFITLVSAGIGVPVSEDILCIYAGSVIGKMEQKTRLSLLLALYFGVVVSDALTFLVGRAFRAGFIKGGSKFGLEKTDANEKDADLTDAAAISPNTKLRKRERLKRKILSAGNYIGVVTRFSFGVRGPLMLMSGFSGKIEFFRFICGSAVGAVGSLAVQLGLGYGMRNGAGLGAALRELFGAMKSMPILSCSVASCVVLAGFMVKRRRSLKKGIDMNDVTDLS